MSKLVFEAEDASDTVQYISKDGKFVIGPDVNYKRVDARLVKIAELSASYLEEGYLLLMHSGYRNSNSGFHPKGKAIDCRIILDDGRQLENYQEPDNFRLYEVWAQHCKKLQVLKYPELNKALRWGGYFGGSIGPNAKYGAMDLMHLDLGGTSVGMAAGSFSGGLNSFYKKSWRVNNSKGMGNIGNFQLSQISPSKY